MQAFASGLRLGKLGYESSHLDHAPGDRSEVAQAERRGWTVGHAAHLRAMEAEADA